MRFGAAKRIAIMPQVPYFAAVPLALKVIAFNAKGHALNLVD
jgi:hypothetical protein